MQFADGADQSIGRCLLAMESLQPSSCSTDAKDDENRCGIGCRGFVVGKEKNHARL